MWLLPDPALGCRPILFVAPEVAVTPLGTVGSWMMGTWARVDLEEGGWLVEALCPCAPCSCHPAKSVF